MTSQSDHLIQILPPKEGDLNTYLYFDYNATTPIDPSAREAMLPFLTENFGNPSNLYELGKRSAKAIAKAREQAANLLGAQPSEIIFNSGGTESITTAILSALAIDPKKRHIITSTVEHSATIALCRDLEQRGYKVTWLPVDTQGNLSLLDLEQAITSATAIVSLLWANNETGVLFPAEKIAAITESKGVPLHLDAVQAVGKVPIDLSQITVHYLSLSGHKLYAPKGVGALYVHRHALYTPLLRGSQEDQRRGGTQNVASIVALGQAAFIAYNQQSSEPQRQAVLRDRLETILLNTLEDVHLNGNGKERLPNTSNLTFKGIEAESALFLFDQEGLCCSSGSACSSGSTKPSHVLTSMGRSRTEAMASLRFSIGRFTTEAEIDRALEIITKVVKKLRHL
ncbi:MAG TPA: aminotransferase class V-fold PLP-dependent enzyme [Chthoniobacterales bacterium]|nr:aminotransferase class V-fold PLP-dependent enzyme [Chthoniobacterales bacterium]